MGTASASVTSMNLTRTIGADVKWLDLDVLADVTIVAGGADGVWTAASARGPLIVQANR